MPPSYSYSSDLWESHLEDLGGDGGGVVPLEVTRLPTVQVGSFSELVVAGVEFGPPLLNPLEKTDLDSDPPWRGIFVIT